MTSVKFKLDVIYAFISTDKNVRDTVKIHRFSHYENDKVLEKYCQLISGTPTKFHGTNLELRYN